GFTCRLQNDLTFRPAVFHNIHAAIAPLGSFSMRERRRSLGMFFRCTGGQGKSGNDGDEKGIQSHSSFLEKMSMERPSGMAVHSPSARVRTPVLRVVVPATPPMPVRAPAPPVPKLSRR